MVRPFDLSSSTEAPRGQEVWTRELGWSGREGFNLEPLRSWKVNGEPAGLLRTYGNLTYATVARSGHLCGSIRPGSDGDSVPTDQPINSQAMQLAWVHGGANGFKALL